MKKFLVWLSLFLVSFMNFGFVFAAGPEIKVDTNQQKKTSSGY